MTWVGPTWLPPEDPCPICKRQFTEEEWDHRHSAHQEGCDARWFDECDCVAREVHAECCPFWSCVKERERRETAR